MTKKAWCWNHFEEIDKSSARCKVENCQSILSTKGSNTKGLNQHLDLLHGIKKPSQDKEPLPPAKRQKTIPEMIKFTTLNETIARQVCEIGLNFNQIAKNDYLRKCLEKDFQTHIPSKPSNISKHFFDFYKCIRGKVLDNIKEIKNEGKKFSTTLDEWTACSNKRFLNINLHYNNEEKSHHFNLGLIPIEGSCNSLRLKELVN